MLKRFTSKKDIDIKKNLFNSFGTIKKTEQENMRQNYFKYEDEDEPTMIPGIKFIQSQIMKNILDNQSEFKLKDN